MAQGFAADDDENGERARRGPHDTDRYQDHDDSHRWPTEAPSAAVARVVLKVDAAISLKRTAAAAWLTAHHYGVPSLPQCLPLRPTRMELAVIIALAEIFGAALYKNARFAPVLDCIADDGAIALVQRVMYGARPETDFDVTALTAENARLNDVLRDAHVAFEFVCASWPEVFLAETHAALSKIGVQVGPTDPEPMPPSSNDGNQDDEDDGESDNGDEGEEGGHG